MYTELYTNFFGFVWVNLGILGRTYGNIVDFKQKNTGHLAVFGVWLVEAAGVEPASPDNLPEVTTCLSRRDS